MAKDNGSNRSWGGRFSVAPSSLMAEYTDSQHYDRRLFREDIAASKAHAAMLGRQGIISPAETESIIKGLDNVLAEIESGQFDWKMELEDVHMNIEARLTQLIGVAGKKLHTGRSRNDQVGLTFRLHVARRCDAWRDACVALCGILCELAKNNQDVVMPGFTHLQPAQPVSLAQHLLAYAGMFKRDYERLADADKRTRISPLGAAALAGSTYPLDPESVAAEVGFHGVYANSMDAVSDRDFVLESLFCGSAIMMHLSRLCEEIALWATPAFGFVKLPDEFATGSSIMPQKKNPDVAELMRGKTGRAYGNLVAMLTVMKGLPLAYNRDMQEDKEGFFDTDATVYSSLVIMTAMLEKLVFRPDRMANACRAGYLNATELADYLASSGIPFREAHKITGKIVAMAEKQNKGLEDLSLDELRSMEPGINDDVFQVLDYATCVKRRETSGGTGPKSVDKQLYNFFEWLESVSKKNN